MKHPHRLGFLIPATNTTFEPETYAVLPPDVTAHFVRVPFSEVSQEQLEAMRSHVSRLGSHLATARVLATAFACTTGSLIGGPGYDNQVIREMGIGGLQNVTTTSTAVVNALNALNVERIAIAAPYETWLTDLEARFLESAGFTVVGTASLGLRRYIADVEPTRVFELVTQLAENEPEAIFISCTNLRSIEVMRDAESRLQVPVISSNLATWWDTFRLAGLAPTTLSGDTLPSALLRA